MLGRGVTFACVPLSWQLGLLIGFEQVLGNSPHQSTLLQCYTDLQSNAASRAMTIYLPLRSSALQLHTQSRQNSPHSSLLQPLIVRPPASFQVAIKAKVAYGMPALWTLVF